MNWKAIRAIAEIAVVAMACVSVTDAHHSSSMFEVSRAIWIKGTVVLYEAVNPHSRMMIEEVADDGQVRRWTVEGPRLGRLEQLGVDEHYLKVGDVVEVCGFFPREGVAVRWPSRETFVHGRVLVLANGQRWLWGPYGHLEHCVDRSEWNSINRGTTPLRPDEIP